jgi:hypothetical protein
LGLKYASPDIQRDGNAVNFDGRSFVVNGKRQLYIGGSVHYPRATAAEWPTLLKEVKASGINIVQTYVFWDLHEPKDGEFNFPKDPNDNSNFVEFIRQAQKAGLAVHLRLGPYVCAEWNYGGFPAWMHELGATFRTDDPAYLSRMFRFLDKTLEVVEAENLLLKDGGPIVMLQIENEFGNMEKFYGDAGPKYVETCASYADKHAAAVQVPWIMCQQGEGAGTAPPAHIVNACNGYYCDDWISKHAEDFPNQPHMFTENWPGWYQRWGESVPHRPASDVAFSVARWFARGGSYMNYYMAFGGTSFARTVGGPSIITSYDYDVQVGEYLTRQQPKFDLLEQLHGTLQEFKTEILGEMPPTAHQLSANCESHTYGLVAANKQGETANHDSSHRCIVFVSNTNTDVSALCSLPSGAQVAPWSVSIFQGKAGSSGCSELRQLYSTKQPTTATKLDAAPLPEAQVRSWERIDEPLPSLAINESYAKVVSADHPIEQLSLTGDSTDYLWVTAEVQYDESSGKRATRTTPTLSFDVGGAGGTAMHVFVNGKRLPDADRFDPAVPIPHPGGVQHKKFHDVPLQQGTNSLKVLFTSMGLQNYGPYLERVKVGIVSDMEVDGVAIRGEKPYSHFVGLVGEQQNFFGHELSSKPWQVTGVKTEAVHTEDSVQPLSWYKGSLDLPKSLPKEFRPALDMSAFGKGQVWVNGHMVGRFWDIRAPERGCSACDEATYTGSYNPAYCRTGCGEASQRYYKIPADWLYVDQANTIVVFDEIGSEKTLDLPLVNMAALPVA